MARAAQEAAIIAGKDDGKTVREIAEETGLSVSAVQRLVPIEQSAETVQAAAPPVGLSDTAQEKLTVLFKSPEVENWGSALRALRQLDGQVDVFPRLIRAGMQIAVCRSIPEVLAALAGWGVPTRGTS